MGRLSVVFTNVLILIPVFILLLASAIIATKDLSTLKKVKEETAAKWMRVVEIALWILFAGGLVFSFTIGIILIPWVITIPYLHGFVLVTLGIINFLASIVFFYAANAIRGSDAYKKEDDKNHARDVAGFKRLVGGGVAMLLASLFMVIYSVVTIISYHRGGGLTGDAALVGKYGGDIAMLAGQPELAIPLQALGGAAEKNLNEGQKQQLGARADKVDAAKKLNQHYNKGGLDGILKNPEMLKILLK